MPGSLQKPRRPITFDPAPHERELVAIIDAIDAHPGLDGRSLDRLLREHPRGGRGLFSKSEIIAGFRRFGPARRWRLDEADFVGRLRLRPVRTLSGVTPVTVLTKPFPCPGRCIFCPSDVRMPKSYLADEPGAQRAEDNGFDPYLQTWNRLAAYRNIGHPVDKVELIVLGGTWSFHPEPYQVWFVKRCLDATNDFGRGVDRRAEAGETRVRFAAIETRVDGRGAGPGYNHIVGGFLAEAVGAGLLHPAEDASWEALAEAQRGSETAKSRAVGLSLETRPDHVTEAEVLRLRRLGATKVQIGIQSLSDAVLEANRRGHDVAASRRAIRLLRAAGFKIQAHWMANLLGATPASDARDYARLFEDADFRPDELKIYPCSLVESAELMVHYESGRWRPYGPEELTDLLIECLAETPRYCRLTRVIRDFSSADIVAGNRTANLREVAERRLREQGRRGGDIRSREIRGGAVRPGELRLRQTTYASSVGGEVFLEFVTEDDRLAAFLRLTLPAEPSFVPELRRSALVREVHVYGASLSLGHRAAGAAQHAGLGRALLDAAASRARDAGFEDLAVISAVGTRAYYRRQGFRDGELYQHRALAGDAP